jgi:hypothetical protein
MIRYATITFEIPISTGENVDMEVLDRLMRFFSTHQVRNAPAGLSFSNVPDDLYPYATGPSKYKILVIGSCVGAKEIIADKLREVTDDLPESDRINNDYAKSVSCEQNMNSISQQEWEYLHSLGAEM